MKNNDITIYPVACRIDAQLLELMRAVGERTNGLFLGLQSTQKLGEVITTTIIEQVSNEQMLNRICETVDALIQSGERNMNTAIKQAVDICARDYTIKKTTITSPFTNIPGPVPNIFLTATHLSQIRSQMGYIQFQSLSWNSAEQRVECVVQHLNEQDKQRYIRIVKQNYEIN